MATCPYAHIRAAADDALTWLRSDPSLRVLAGIRILGRVGAICIFVAPSIFAAVLAALTVQDDLPALLLIPLAGAGGLLFGVLAIVFIGLWIAPLTQGILPRVLLPWRLPPGPTGLLVARPDVVLVEAGATAHQRAQALALLMDCPSCVQAIFWYQGRPYGIRARARHRDPAINS